MIFFRSKRNSIGDEIKELGLQGFPLCDKSSIAGKSSVSVNKQLDFDGSIETKDEKDTIDAGNIENNNSKGAPNTNGTKSIIDVEEAKDKECPKDSASQTEKGIIFLPRGNYLRCCILLGVFLFFSIAFFGAMEIDDKVRYSTLRPKFFEDSFVIFSYKKVRPSYL